DRLRRVLDGGAKDFARMNQTAIQGTHRDAVGAHDLVPGVEANDVKFLLDAVRGEPGKPLLAESDGVVGAADRLRLPLTVLARLQHAPPELNAGHDLAKDRVPHGCTDCLQFTPSGLAEPIQTLGVARRDLFTRLERRFARPARA